MAAASPLPRRLRDGGEVSVTPNKADRLASCIAYFEKLGGSLLLPFRCAQKVLCGPKAVWWEEMLCRAMLMMMLFGCGAWSSSAYWGGLRPEVSDKIYAGESPTGGDQGLAACIARPCSCTIM